MFSGVHPLAPHNVRVKRTGVFAFVAGGLWAVLAMCMPFVGVAADGAQALATPQRPSKAPFHVLHSNDTTNVTNCLQSKEAVRPSMEDKYIRASVDEVANTGIDVHMIQPGRGWVPWWQSKAFPISAQLEWKASKKIPPQELEDYVNKGGDVMAVFVDECRKQGQHPFASFRMNDQHHIYAANRGKVPPDQFYRKAGVCAFYADNPQWRIGEDGDTNLTGQLSMNFAVPQVREFRLKQIRELIDLYDIDGIELDFVRHTALFNQKDTTFEQRAQIMTNLVKEVRKALDAKGARVGRYLWLCIRIPGYPETFDRMGIDLSTLTKQGGVDIVNASGHYFTDGQMPIAQLRSQLPDDVALYTELHFTNARGPDEDVGGGKTQWRARRCTPLQLDTVAYVARKRGADGVSTFNFQYYRGTYRQTDVAGSSMEPPYGVFKHISDTDWLSQQPQHYVMAYINDVLRLKSRPFHSAVKQGVAKEVLVDMVPSKGGWRADGRMRIQARTPMEGTVWSVRLNGVALKPTADVSEPFPNPYPDGLGKPEDYRAWVVPAALLKDGENSFELTYESGAKTVNLCYMDVALPAASHANRKP